ncbi:MAG: DNA alkylation repair protein [Acholeplasmataceae bacterium]|nr:DNA alkylation repair protein [Acholeplasmataceae bacterium]
MIEEVKKILLSKQDKRYQNFTSTLTPNKKNILGVRMPEIRNIAKEINKKNPLGLLDENDFSNLELELIHAILIGNIKDINVALTYADAFLPVIDTWNTCDLFCGSFKLTRKYPEVVWNWLRQYETSNNPMTLRVIMVMMLLYFLNDDYLDKVLDKLEKINADEYYFKMGKAWLLAEMTVNYPNKSLNYLNRKDIDLQIKKMAIRKIKDSFRISDTIKNNL